MPIRNEAAFIGLSLGAVLSQDYPADRLEIIVVDGMSEDRTQEIVQRIIASQPKALAVGQGGRRQDRCAIDSSPRIVLLENPAKIAPAGLNTGIRQAKGDIILRVDGHAILEPDYIRRCVETMMKTGADCVGGAIESVGVGYIGKAIAVAMSSSFGVGGSQFRVATVKAKPTLTDTVPFPAFRQEVFERVGLYNERMVRHQDYEFNYRLRKAGGQILLLPSLRVKYYVRSNLRSLWRQYWQYGVWKGSFLRVYPTSLKWRHLIPPLFVFTIALSSVFSMISNIGFWTLGTAIGIYAAFLAAGLIVLSRGGNFNTIPILPVILACLHFSYGMGIWLGFIAPKVSADK
jgi:cellulose synthase/poly-beta-1,6-N-acetylglucosamine synthase-like glycosyltransferase